MWPAQLRRTSSDAGVERADKMGRAQRLFLQSLVLVSTLALTGCWNGTAKSPYDERRYQGMLGGREGMDAEAVQVLMFTKTAGFRHGSIPTSKEVMEALSKTHGFELNITEDASVFAEDVLSTYDVIMFASTTGEVLNAAQRGALEGFIAAGGGFVGVHAASDTLYTWPWYGELVGAYFNGHPLWTSVATLHNEDPDHPSSQHLGRSFQLRDEWYFFDRNPRSDVHVLLTLDGSSNAVLATYARARGNGDHPITWCHPYGGGRSWYTALGHRSAVWRDVRFQEMLLGGTLWAAGRTEGTCARDDASRP
ncbi:MAG: Cytochrome c551/c552 [uncultured Chloroflexia bacterium]|uniref:Cytochrome c551/c552 n=1 Tax=uncultured Chloroflexia bacterium TaxID=1672391 RepID=A0A6J4MYK5_9CHLR|nr:MAG: Cytochrome c551/c552 [uncultured Chloroflexia bacterium]